MRLENCVQNLLEFYDPLLANFLKEKCFKETEINQHCGKILIAINKDMIKLKNAIEALNGDLNMFQNTSEQEKIEKELINGKKNILSSKLLEKKLLIELIRLKANVISGTVLLPNYVNERDMLLKNIIIHRAKLYRDKESLKHFCYKNDILLDTNWFMQYDICMTSNKRNSLFVVQNKLDESRQICFEAQSQYDNGTLLKGYTENQKEVAVVSLLIPFYVNEKISINRITLFNLMDDYKAEKGQR